MKYAFATTFVTVLAAASNPAASYVSMTNNCPFPVFYSQAWHEGHSGDVMIEPNGGTGYEEMKEPFANGKTNGASLKFHKGDGLLRGILQFEYAKEYDGDKVPGIYWDFSHVDGDRPGVPGRSPFADVDVMVIPLGTGQGYGTCDDVYCSAGEICEGSYQYDKDDKKTKYCPLELELFEIEFCVMDGMKRV
ncbi:hypothetical protein DL98DRAFT_583238 [Cadophora sp. DSE1049]|nr:hypothetical protein DL98DRAFT_583238 [Cadophora sp. DSE1049]